MCQLKLQCFSPSYWDTWIQVVKFGGTQGNLLVLLPIGGLYLQLHQLFLRPLHGFLLCLHSPEPPKNNNIRAAYNHTRIHNKHQRAKFSWVPFKQIFWHSLLGFFISAYFGISLGTFQFSFSLTKLFLLCVNLVLMNKWMKDKKTFRWSSRPCTNKKNLISIETMKTRSQMSHTFAWRFCIDFSKVLGGALWWLHRMATALLARL